MPARTDSPVGAFIPENSFAELADAYVCGSATIQSIFEPLAWELCLGRLASKAAIVSVRDIAKSSSREFERSAATAIDLMLRNNEGLWGEVAAEMPLRLPELRVGAPGAPLVLALVAGGSASFQTGSYANAFAYLHEAVGDARMHSLHLMLSCVRSSIALMQGLLGRYDDACNFAQLAYENLPPQRKVQQKQRNDANLSYAAVIAARPDDAVTAAHGALTSHGIDEQPLTRAIAHTNLCWAHSLKGDAVAAATHWREAHLIGKANALRRLNGPLLLNLARVYFAQGRLARAERVAALALRWLGEQGRARYEDHALEFLIRVACARGQWERAMGYSEQLVALRTAVIKVAHDDLIVGMQSAIALTKTNLELKASRDMQDALERGIAEKTAALAASEAEARWLAEHEMCTNLRNRRSLDLRLPSILAEASQLQVFCVELVDLRSIVNAISATAAGALVNQAIAELWAMFGESLVFRYRAQQFVALRRGPLDDAGMLSVAQQVVDRLQALTTGTGVPMAVAVGCAQYPEQANAGELLCDHADLATVGELAHGQSSVRKYTPALREALNDRFNMSSLLRRAPESGQLRLLLQPQFSLRDGRIRGAEALVRWQHPERGVLAPNEFIALAESTGEIVQIDAWVLREACHSAAAWLREGRDIVLSVNVSARSFDSPTFVPHIATTLREFGLPGDRLELELTESVLPASLDGVVARMRALRELGVRIALDDFGTGYASLSYLTRLPLTTLKIDRSFIEPMLQSAAARAVVEATVRLGHDLGLELVAEGIEHADHAAALCKLGVHFVQGYLYARPEPARELARYFDGSRTPIARI